MLEGKKFFYFWVPFTLYVLFLFFYVSFSPQIALGSGIDTTTIYSSGTTTYDMSTASGTQTIAHGLGVIPKLVRIDGYWITNSRNPVMAISLGSWSASGNHAIQNYQSDAVNNTNSNAIALQENSGKYQQASINVDVTNITLTWTKGSTPTGTAVLHWEAEGQMSQADILQLDTTTQYGFQVIFLMIVFCLTMYIIIYMIKKIM
jgi:hypothetical protein